MSAPVLSCCRARGANAPSGRLAYFHSDACPAWPGSRVGRETHPAGSAVETWMAHTRGCSCIRCAQVEFYLDRDDDEIEVDAL